MLGLVEGLSSFFLNNWEEIIINIASALIGAYLGAVFAYKYSIAELKIQNSESQKQSEIQNQFMIEQVKEQNKFNLYLTAFKESRSVYNDCKLEFLSIANQVGLAFDKNIHNFKLNYKVVSYSLSKIADNIQVLDDYISLITETKVQDKIAEHRRIISISYQEVAKMIERLTTHQLTTAELEEIYTEFNNNLFLLHRDDSDDINYDLIQELKNKIK